MLHVKVAEETDGYPALSLHCFVYFYHVALFTEVTCIF